MADLTVAAIPFYYATMGAEAAWYAKHRIPGEREPGDYELRDTLTSLAMGTGSLLVPLVTRPLMRRFDLASGRWAKAALGVTAIAATTVVATDAILRSGRLDPGELPREPARGTGEPGTGEPVTGEPVTDEPATGEPVGAAHRQGSDPGRGTSRNERRSRWRRIAKRVAGSAAVTAIAGTGALVAGTWATRTTATRAFRHRVLPDWGSGPVATIAAVFAWDAIYYWNHRIQHEARYLWAIHVVHHSSERYNLSTALRQPVADALGTFVPYGLMSLLGCRPALIETARGVNLIYQYWIHTEVIRSLGPLEGVLNTPSHHRVHHGSNKQYLDRNHGSILIVWDKLFGTFEPEAEPVRYGLTRNIGTFNPLRVAGHEYTDIASDVAEADNWADRIGYVVRGPGWAYERRAARAETGLSETGLAEAGLAAPIGS